jgi:hypothetical protein
MFLKNLIPAASLLCITLMVATAWAEQEKPDLSTPEKAAQSFFDALEKGDADGAKAATVPEEQQQEAVVALTKFVSGMKKVEKAAIEKFGEEGRQILEPKNGQGFRFKVDRDLEEARVEVDGEIATVHTPEEEKPIKLRRIEEQWRVDLAAVENEQDLRQAVPLFEAIASAAERTAGEINDGAFSSVEEAEQALGLRIYTALMTAARPDQADEAQPAREQVPAEQEQEEDQPRPQRDQAQPQAEPDSPRAD